MNERNPSGTVRLQAVLRVNIPEQWRVWKRGASRLERVEMCDRKVSTRMKGKV